MSGVVTAASVHVMSFKKAPVAFFVTASGEPSRVVTFSPSCTVEKLHENLKHGHLHIKNIDAFILLCTLHVPFSKEDDSTVLFTT